VLTVSLATAETEVVNGAIEWTGNVSEAVVIPAGILNNTNYRVAYDTPDGTILRTESETITGFTAVAPAAYGSATAPIDVGYVVLVSTAQSGGTGGTASFTSASNQVTITFASAFSTDNYRVLLTPDGFFTARVLNKTRSGFTIELGISLLGAETATVGYDVLV
jgi:hypothetical protein